MSIKTYKRGAAVQMTANFKSTEFDCNGSSSYHLDTKGKAVDIVVIGLNQK